MASKTYTVKSGDTLSGIAKNYGVNLSDISGYKSGDPNKIGVGEVLSIGGGDTTPTTKTTADQYAGAVKDALGGTSTGSTGTKTTDDYLTTLTGKIDSARTTVNDAATKLANLKTTTYDQAYKDAGLDTIKTKISDLDTTIANKKAERDAAVAKVKNNPGLSASLLTGTVAKLSDKANAEINDLISQRNGLAGDYNTGLTKVNQVVSNVVGDAETSYNAAVKALESLTGQAKDYQSNLVDTLKNAQTKNYQDQSLAIALMNAETAANKANTTGDSSWKLAISPLTGKPTYWYNSKGETRPLSAADVANASISQTGGNEDTTDTTDTTDSQSWFSKLLSSLNPFK